MSARAVGKSGYLPYTILTIVAVLGFALGSLFLSQDSYIKNHVKDHVSTTGELYKFHLERDSETIRAVMTRVAENKALRLAWLKRDRQALLELALPIYEKINANHRITHFYFHGPDGVNFLRVHSPQRSGDVIDRYTLGQAMQHNTTVSGVELGPLGTFTLRMVHPWEVDGEVIGYLELGEEIGHVLPKVNTTLGGALFVTIEKKFLTREGWEEGTSIYGSASGWDDYEDFVVAQSTVESPELERRVFDLSAKGKVGGLTQANKRYYLGSAPLLDVGGTKVGAMYMVIDITEQKEIAQNMMFVMVLVGLLLAIAIAMLLGRFLARQRTILEEEYLADMLEESREREREKGLHLDAVQVAQQELKRQSLLLETILDSIPTPVTYKDGEGRYLGCNAAFKDFFGVSQEEAFGKSSVDILPVDSAAVHAAADAKVLGGDSSYIYEVHAPNAEGELRDLMVYKSKFSFPDEEGVGLVGAMFDITAQNESERTLRASEAHLRSVIDYAPIGIITIDDNGKLSSANPTFCNMLGFSESEILRFTICDLVHPDDREGEANDCAEVKVKAQMRMQSQKRMIAKDGKTVHTQIAMSRVNVGGEGAEFTLCMVQDITVAKAAEEELQRLATAVEQADEAIAITDESGAIEYVNPAYERIGGMTATEVRGMNLAVVEGVSGSTLSARAWKSLSKGEVWRGTFNGTRKSGETYEARCTISPIRDADAGTLSFVVVKQDISKETALERQLRQAQKMEAIGTLAGGIAHDFNNLLQVIGGYTQVLTGMDHDRGSGDYLEKIAHSVDRGAELVSRILAFSRPEESLMRPVALNDLLTGTMKMLRQTLPKAVALESELAPELHLIKALPDQLEQLVMNLATNASDSMPEGGTLRITTENVTIKGSKAAVNGEHVPDGYVRLVISDTGHGMTPKVLERIFDPFFTTKEIGKGTGLGLYTAYTTVQNHGGEITCKSAPGEGTTFTVDFRATLGEVQWPKVEEEQPKEVRHEEGMLLLVDDEPGILLGTSEILKLNGFETLTASNGEEALDIYGQHGDAIDLVLVDLGMPGMGGLECIRRLIRLNAELKIVVASGYPEEKEGGLAKKAGARRFVKKPYRMDDLVEIIHQVLDEQ